MIHTHRVLFADCTVGNHVYYGRYLEFLEAARGAFFADLGWSFLQLESEDVALPVVRAELDFRAPARYDDLLEIEVRLEELGRVKLAFGYRITRPGGRTVLEARTFHGITTHGDRPRRLPVALAEAMSTLVQG